MGHTVPTPGMKGNVVDLTVLGSGRTVPAEAAGSLAGVTVYRTAEGGWLLPAFRGCAVAVEGPLPEDPDSDAFAALVLDWVAAVRAHDWAPWRGAQLEGDEDWLDLRTAMVRVGWGPAAAQSAWDACAARPYHRSLPAAAGWAGGGWVVPASADEPDPAFARPVLETRGLLRWAYISRWDQPPGVPDGPPSPAVDPAESGWADVLSRLRQDHYSGESIDEAERLAVAVLERVGLGPRSELEAEDEPLPDRSVAAACTAGQEVVRAAAWFLLRADADTWLACGYGECQHHWAVEAEEDAFQTDEVLELAGYGVVNPVDAAATRRRLLTLAFGDINDVPLAGAGDVADFVAFYRDWVAGGRSEQQLELAARDLRGDE